MVLLSNRIYSNRKLKFQLRLRNYLKSSQNQADLIATLTFINSTLQELNRIWLYGKIVKDTDIISKSTHVSFVNLHYSSSIYQFYSVCFSILVDLHINKEQTYKSNKETELYVPRSRGGWFITVGCILEGFPLVCPRPRCRPRHLRLLHCPTLLLLVRQSLLESCTQQHLQWTSQWLWGLNGP